MKALPPRFFVQFFRWYAKEGLQESILGDLEEEFEDDVATYGPIKAKRRFIWNVLRFFRKGIINPAIAGQKLNTTAMFIFNIKITLRSFRRFKSSFLINITGLSCGLTCALLISLWINSEWSMNKFHEHNDNLYQVLQNINIIGEEETLPETPAYLGATIAEEFPQVELYASVVTPDWYGADGVLAYEGKQEKVNGQYASKDYFRVFSYELLVGQKESVLSEKFNAVISEKYAKLLFGDEDPIGKQVTWAKSEIEGSYLITGVFKNLPSNTTDNFDIVFTLDAFLDRYPHIREWRNSDPFTYLVLNDQTDKKQFEAQLKNFLSTKNEHDENTLMLQKYSDTYLYGTYENGQILPGRMKYVQLFSIVAALVLIIACINFMNLSTAKASRRMKEIGIKKSMGVNRKSLVIQFFTEAFLLSFFSILIAIGLTALFIDAFNELSGKTLNVQFDKDFLIQILLVLGITTLLAGSYPAFYLSNFDPVSILKGKLRKSKSDFWVRKGLVIFQFCSSMILIVCVAVISSQIQFISSKNLGFNKDQIIYFSSDGELTKHSKAFLDELKAQNSVVSVGEFGHDLLGGRGTTTGVYWEGKGEEEKVQFGNLEVGIGLLETFEIDLIAGRSFSNEFGDEATKIIFNQEAIAVMGLEHPVGKIIKLWGQNREIIGVTKNFHFESLHSEISPCFIQLGTGLSTTVVRIAANGRELETLSRIEETYHKYNPNLNFEASFFDKEYEALYKSELQVAGLAKSFAAIAIVISCLGLFGLATFAAEKRKKEIGIRKVLGSSVKQLVFLVSKDFSVMVITGILTAIPIGYYLMSIWLDSFTYRIELSPYYFIFSGITALAIAMLTVSLNTIKAVSANPVESLKDE